MPSALAKSALFLAAAFVAFAPLPSAADETITWGTVGSGSPTQWPLYIATAKGYFAEKGIKIDRIAIQSSAAVQQQLAAGSLNAGGGGLVDPLRAIDRGAPVALFRIETQAPPYEIDAKKGLKNLAELKGKTIIVGGANDITRIYLERMLGPNGVLPGSYDLVYAGAAAARYAALQSGAVDAAILTPPFNFSAVATGYSSLGRVIDYASDLPFTGYAVNVEWGRKHKDTLRNFLAAYTRAVDWFYQPANRDEAAKIFVDVSGSAMDEALKSYDFYVGLKAYDRIGAVTETQIASMVGVLKQLGEIEGATDAKRFIDPELATLANSAP
jgi:ABC-type nitrate/sulfonate/bicarbonate transport system substrate-binding protein